MAIKKIRIRPEGSNSYADYLYPETSADQVVETTDKKIMTSAERTKLSGIESGATADQTASEIKTLYESNSNTNAYTDAEKTKLSGIASGAQVNTVTSVASKTGAVTLVKGDVGLGNVDNVKQMPIAGGTFTGQANAQNNTAYTTAQLRNVFLSTADPSSGGNGDIWLKYKP